jgi:hypothetical protein
VWFDRQQISPHVPEDIEGIDDMCSCLDDLVSGEVERGIPHKRIVVGKCVYTCNAFEMMMGAFYIAGMFPLVQTSVCSTSIKLVAGSRVCLSVCEYMSESYLSTRRSVMSGCFCSVTSKQSSMPRRRRTRHWLEGDKLAFRLLPPWLCWYIIRSSKIAKHTK